MSFEVAPPRLVRAVGLAGLIAIAINGVVGAGIFVLPATVAALAGAASPAAYAVAASLMALVVLCFAEAGSLFEETGGPYVYARAAFGPFAGFLVGWMYLLSRLAAAAAVGNAFAAYLGYFWPALAQGPGRVAVLTLSIGLLAAANVVGVRSGARTVNILTVAKMLPLLLFVGAGLAAADPSRYRLLALPATGALRQASLLLVFAFGGFENASVPAEEVKDPRRHLPIALLVSIGMTAVLYVLIQIVALGTLPGLAADPTPLASAASRFLGPIGAGVMTLGAVFSTLGTESALILVGPRILYAFARGGQMPGVLGRIHPLFRTPHVAIAAFAILAWAAALAGSFGQLAAVSAIARLVFSAATCLALPVLRRRMAPSRFRVPGGLFVPLAAAALALWLLLAISRDQALAGAAALVAGLALYAVFGSGRFAPEKGKLSGGP
ncbi:MAG TPA: APC family permease [Thermoanaerobaculia bacterium]|nr:APC family permease [Thermoanaerobaculia bacterium]